jgi:histidyl-tRNA synthetase
MAYKIPKGTQDLFGSEAYQWQQLEKVLRRFCDLYNFQEIRTPVFEHTNVFKRDNDSSDMVNKEMYTFFPANSKTSITLRPEGTAGVVRSYVENKMFASPDLPVKLFYMGPMHRHERPQKGRLRIFNQFGVESLGLKSPYADAEAMIMAYSLLKELGLKDLTILLNTLGDDASRDAYRTALREYFAPHIDSMCADCKRRYEQNPLRLLDCKVDHDHPAMKGAPDMHDYLNEESLAYYQTVKDLLDQAGIPYREDSSLVRGLDYYTHTVFEIVSDSKEMGSQSTLLAGGRYDNLIPAFGGPEQSGIGWAMGIERLMIALAAEGISFGERPGLDAYVMVLDPKVRNYAFSLLNTLRQNGYRSEMDLQDKKFKGQFKAADRAKARFILLIGEDEMANGTVTLKDKETNEQFSISQSDLVSSLAKRVK